MSQYMRDYVREEKSVSKEGLSWLSRSLSYMDEDVREMLADRRPALWVNHTDSEELSWGKQGARPIFCIPEADYEVGEEGGYVGYIPRNWEYLSKTFYLDSRDRWICLGFSEGDCWAIYYGPPDTEWKEAFDRL